MVITMPMLILLIVVIVVLASGSGYGYYNGGAYANPLGVLVTLLIIGLLVWLLFGGVYWTSAPPPP
jgi:hypothetical protein